MHCRFIARGGWERSIDTSVAARTPYDVRPPEFWRIPEPPTLSTKFDPTEPLAPVTERVFRRVEFRNPRSPLAVEWVFVERGSETDLYPDSVRPHECAGLARANRRLVELESLVARAADYFGAIGEMIEVLESLGAIEHRLDDPAIGVFARLSKELDAVAREARAEGRIPLR